MSVPAIYVTEEVISTYILSTSVWYIKTLNFQDFRSLNPKTSFGAFIYEFSSTNCFVVPITLV